MDKLHLAGGILLLIAALPIIAVFIAYPLSLYLRGRQLNDQDKPTPPTACALPTPTVTMIIAARNGESLINAKVTNCLALDYPAELLNFIIFSDGSTDLTIDLLQAYQQPQLTVLSDTAHIGKAAALNRSVEQSGADILVFSDLDAILTQDAISLLVNKLQDPTVGGVCGQRALASAASQSASPSLKQSQQQYIALDSWIKLQESRFGYLTSNDGKLYAIRRDCFKPIAEGVTDDLYCALNVIAQDWQFVFEPRAIASIKTPARNPQHEISRRRRITCRSLTGIFSHKALLKPDAFGIALFINKVLRRTFGLSLLLILLGNSLLLGSHFIWSLGLIGQLSLYTLVGLISTKRYQPAPSRWAKGIYALSYFILGNIGMLLGGVDFLRRRKVVKWEPNKHD